MQTVIIIAAIVVACLVAWFVFVRPSKAKSGAQKTEEAQRAERLYNLAMNPTESGMPFMFALETCRHCRKTKEFFDEHQIGYNFLYVDRYSGDMRTSLMDKVRSYNPRGSFPTVVLPDGKVVVGFREQLLREALLHDSESTA